jgi:Lon protease-like protein
MCAGVERFKIVGIVEERPVLVCEVEYLQEEDNEGEEVRGAHTESLDACLRLPQTCGAHTDPCSHQLLPADMWRAHRSVLSSLAPCRHVAHREP